MGRTASDLLPPAPPLTAAFGRPFFPRTRLRTCRACGFCLAIVNDHRPSSLFRQASRQSPEQVLNDLPYSLLLLRTTAHSSRRRTEGSWRLPLPRLPAKDRQCLRSTGKLFCSVQGLRYRHRIRPRRRSWSHIQIQVLPNLRDHRLPLRRRSQRIRRRRRGRVCRP